MSFETPKIPMEHGLDRDEEHSHDHDMAYGLDHDGASEEHDHDTLRYLH